VSRSFALLVVGLAALYVMLINPFSLLFFIPLIAWLFIRGRKGAGRTLDIFLALLGGLVVYFLLYTLGFVLLHMGFAIFWFLMMMFSIGMIGFQTVLTVSAIMAAGLVMLVNPPMREAEPSPA
jgi:hypothetical protein